jgi:hypothetical protein
MEGPHNSLATPEGFEPPTLGSEDQCSIQLSYGAARHNLAYAVSLSGPIPRHVAGSARKDGPVAVSGRETSAWA